MDDSDFEQSDHYDSLFDDIDDDLFNGISDDALLPTAAVNIPSDRDAPSRNPDSLEAGLSPTYQRSSAVARHPLASIGKTAGSGSNADPDLLAPDSAPMYATGRSPTPPDGTEERLPFPLEWTSDGLRVAARSSEIQKVLLATLSESVDEHEFVRRLQDREDVEIREGVDLLIAGMLQQQREERVYAQTLQRAISLLITTRAMRFSLHQRFTALVDNSASQELQVAIPTNTRATPSQETDEQVVHRVWGTDFRERLGLEPNAGLFRPLTRLAGYAETLNQNVHSLARYLKRYMKLRTQTPRKGQRKVITKGDIDSLANDLRQVIRNSRRDYNSVVTRGNIFMLTQLEPVRKDNNPSAANQPDSETQDTPNNPFKANVTDVFGMPVDMPVLSAQLPEIDTFYKKYSISADHRTDWVPVPKSHLRFQPARGAPLIQSVSLELWRLAANIAGYAHDGSYRYDRDNDLHVQHARLLSYHSDEHAAYHRKYNGSWIVVPPFANPNLQATVWVEASRVFNRCIGLHPRHRVSVHTTRDGIVTQMNFGNNVLLRNQDNEGSYPHFQPSIAGCLKRIGVNPELEYEKIAEVFNTATIVDLDARYTHESVILPPPICLRLKCSAPGMRPSFEETFGIGAVSATQARHHLDRYRWIGGEGTEEAELNLERIKAMFPSTTTSRIGDFEHDNRRSVMGYAALSGEPLFFSSGPSVPPPSAHSDIVPETQPLMEDEDRERVESLAARFELSGNYATAGLLTSFGVAPNGACAWMKLHRGEALLLLSYTEETIHDTVVPVELHAGDVFAFQPGQHFAVYYIRSSVITTGNFYLPTRITSLKREFARTSGVAAFKQKLIWGSWAVMRMSLSLRQYSNYDPVFHLYMITLGLMLTSDEPGMMDKLGLREFLWFREKTEIDLSALAASRRNEMCNLFRVYVTSCVSEFTSPFVDPTTDDARDIVAVLRYCAMPAAELLGRLNKPQSRHDNSAGQSDSSIQDGNVTIPQAHEEDMEDDTQDEHLTTSPVGEDDMEDDSPVDTGERLPLRRIRRRRSLSSMMEDPDDGERFQLGTSTDRLSYIELL